MGETRDLEGLELLPEGVVVVDAARQVRRTNRRARHLLGLAGDPTGKPVADVVDLRDDSGARVTADLLPDSDGRQPVVDRLAERLLRVRLPSGQRRPVTVAGRVLDDGGLVLTFRHAGRRERLDVTRSDLVATVSHEIRSPLTSVKGFTRTLLAKWDRFSDEQKRQMLATINEDADRVTRLLTELLDVARIDAGRVQLHRRMADIGEILLRVVGKAEHYHDGRVFDVDVEADLPEVYVDPDKVEQILTNLVGNALEYAPDSPVRVAADDRGDVVEVTVADEGPGIPSDQLRHIFEKFSRGRDNRRSGTGLGLFITKGLAEAHGGRVWAESQVGVGSTFHVVFPKNVGPFAAGD